MCDVTFKNKRNQNNIIRKNFLLCNTYGDLPIEIMGVISIYFLGYKSREVG